MQPFKHSAAILGLPHPIFPRIRELYTRMRVMLSFSLYDPKQALDNHKSADTGAEASAYFETTELLTLYMRARRSIDA